jgi:hypothetical protein
MSSHVRYLDLQVFALVPRRTLALQERDDYSGGFITSQRST